MVEQAAWRRGDLFGGCSRGSAPCDDGIYDAANRARREDKGGYNAHTCFYRPRWCDDPRGRPGYGSTPRPPFPVLHRAVWVEAQQHHRLSVHFNGPVPNDGLGAPSEVLCKPILARVEGFSKALSLVPTSPSSAKLILALLSRDYDKARLDYPLLPDLQQH